MTDNIRLNLTFVATILKQVKQGVMSLRECRSMQQSLRTLHKQQERFEWQNIMITLPRLDESATIPVGTKCQYQSKYIANPSLSSRNRCCGSRKPGNSKALRGSGANSSQKPPDPRYYQRSIIDNMPVVRTSLFRSSECAPSAMVRHRSSAVSTSGCSSCSTPACRQGFSTGPKAR